MKVTRLKKGYRINLSDAEMGMLNAVTCDGFMTHENDDQWADSWEPSEKAALTRRLNKVGQPYNLLSADEDRRA